MFIDSITLHNFRCFSDFHIEFKNRLTVLVGNNGAGKSFILKAVSIAAGTLTSSMDNLSRYGIKKEDALLKCFNSGGMLNTQPQFPVNVTASGKIDSRNISWTRTLNSINGRESLSGAKEMTSVADQYRIRMHSGDVSLYLPIISCYQSGRLWAPYKERKKDPFVKNNRVNGYMECFYGGSDDRLIKKWFKKMTVQQYQRNEKIPELETVQKTLQQAFSQVTGYSDVKVSYNLDTDELDFSYFDQNNRHGKIPISHLSGGYRSVVCLIADIACRMAVLNPQLLNNVLAETEGIVLIDEIELHLHSILQKRILGELMRIFPKVQFIVSTYSPEIIASVKSDSIIILKDNEAKTALNETYGKDANTILNEIMDVSPRVDKIDKYIHKFHQCMDLAKFEEAEAVLQQIESEIGNNDPEINSFRIRLALERMGDVHND